MDGCEQGRRVRLADLGLETQAATRLATRGHEMGVSSFSAQQGRKLGVCGGLQEKCPPKVLQEPQRGLASAQHGGAW